MKKFNIEILQELLEYHASTIVPNVLITNLFIKGWFSEDEVETVNKCVTNKERLAKTFEILYKKPDNVLYCVQDTFVENNWHHAKLFLGTKISGNFSENETPKEKHYATELRDERNWTALHRASRYGNTAKVEELLKNGANIMARANYAYEEWDGVEPSVTALHFAARNGHTDTVQVLLRNHADVNAKDNKGDTPVHRAALDGQTKVVIALLEYGPKLIYAKNDANFTPLHSAAIGGHKDTVVALLDKGAKLTDKSNYTNDPTGVEPSATPLHFATLNGNTEVVQVLLDHGADPEDKDKDGQAPIHLAAREGKSDIVETILNHSASVHKLKDQYNFTPLHWAALNGHKDTAIVLLERGANAMEKANYSDDPPGTEPSVTPLHFAAIMGHTEAARALLSYRADLDAKDRNGHTPAELAKLTGHEHTANVLMGFKMNGVRT
jgi:ankyrin repeat protein